MDFETKLRFFSTRLWNESNFCFAKDDTALFPFRKEDTHYTQFEAD